MGGTLAGKSFRRLDFFGAVDLSTGSSLPTLLWAIAHHSVAGILVPKGSVSARPFRYPRNTGAASPLRSTNLLKKGGMPRLAANLAYLFTERPLLARFAAAAAAGFKAVELQVAYDHAPADIRREIERHGLTMLGINTPAASGGQSGVAGVPGREAEFAALFAKALDFAVGCGARTIHCLTGRVPRAEEGAGERTFVANLARAADLAAEHGIGILIEPLNRRDRPENLLHLPEQAAAIIGEVGRPNVRMQFDFYHVQ